MNPKHFQKYSPLVFLLSNRPLLHLQSRSSLTNLLRSDIYIYIYFFFFLSLLPLIFHILSPVSPSPLSLCSFDNPLWELHFRPTVHQSSHMPPLSLAHWRLLLYNMSAVTCFTRVGEEVWGKRVLICVYKVMSDFHLQLKHAKNNSCAVFLRRLSI